MFGMGDRDDVQSSHDSMSVADTSDITSHVPQAQNRSPVKAPTKQASDADGDKSPTQSKSSKATMVPQRKPTLDGTATRPNLTAPPRSVSGTSAVGSAPGPINSPSTTLPAPRAVPAVLPPIRYSAAAASAVAQPSAPAAVSSTSTGVPPAGSASSLLTAPSTHVPVFTSPLPTAASSALPPIGSAFTASSSTPSQDQVPQAHAPSTSSIQTPVTLANQSPEVQKASLPSEEFSIAASESAVSPTTSHASIPVSVSIDFIH